MLISGELYYCRVRQAGNDGEWSEWSAWHQPFLVERKVAPDPAARLDLERRVGQGELRLLLTAPKVNDYAIEASADFDFWQVLTNLTTESGAAVFNDSVELGGAWNRRFYRARLQAPQN